MFLSARAGLPPFGPVRIRLYDCQGPYTKEPDTRPNATTVYVFSMGGPTGSGSVRPWTSLISVATTGSWGS